MLSVPVYLALAFIVATALAVALFGWAARWSGRALGLLGDWLLVQGGVGLSGFYMHTAGLPPRLALLLGPPLVVIGILLATAAGRRFLASLRLDALTLLHVVRIPVELVLFGLYLHHAVPRLMTFEGRNWDVLAGLTAPVAYFLTFRQPRLGRCGLLLWNGLGLVSLLNIMGNAMLSVPTPLQRFGFEQPNAAILHFPFVWLPGVVVPLVLLAHVVAIRRLWAAEEEPVAGVPVGVELPN